jgi:putative endonuclease
MGLFVWLLFKVVSFRQNIILVPFGSLECGFLTKLWISVCATRIKDGFYCLRKLFILCLFVKITIVYNVFYVFLIGFMWNMRKEFHVKQFTSKTQKTGEIGEDQACMFLMKHGFTILERNVANKFGEIDIVAKSHGVHYFFEVKTGKQGSFINPAENLTKEKLRKILISVEHYCMIKKIKDYRVQGVVVLLPKTEQGISRVEIIDLS